MQGVQAVLVKRQKRGCGASVEQEGDILGVNVSLRSCGPGVGRGAGLSRCRECVCEERGQLGKKPFSRKEPALADLGRKSLARPDS